MTKQEESHSLREVLRSILLPYWISSDRFIAWFSLLGILGLGALVVQVTVLFNSWNSGFYTSLQEKNYPEFLHSIKLYPLLVLGIIIPILVAYFWTDYLIFRWRKWMTAHYLKAWFKNQSYYRLHLGGDFLDNPDQRLSDDLNKFASLSLRLVTWTFRDLLSLASFSIVLWSISHPLNFNFFSKAVSIHGYLFWAALAYAGIGTAVMLRLGRMLVGLDFAQEKAEADFRFSLIRVRENREEIAFHRGENFEENYLKQRFTFIQKNFYALLKTNSKITLVNSLYSNLASTFPLLVSAPLYFNATLKLGELMRIPGAFAAVLGGFSVVIYQYSTFAQWKATANRILSFHSKLIECQIDIKKSGSNPTKDGGPIISLQNVKISHKAIRPKMIYETENAHTEHSLTLPTLEIFPQEKVLINGPSGTGKTSLTRLLRGLWEPTLGTIHSSDHFFFLPQKPYLPIGSLRNCLLYPLLLDDPIKKEDEIKQALASLSLSNLVPNLDMEADWVKILSVGEQQRVHFARILVHKPQFIILDEPTSGMDPLNEKKAFEKLLQTLPEVTLITIGHSSSLHQFHDRVIEFQDNLDPQSSIAEKTRLSVSLA